MLYHSSAWADLPAHSSITTINDRFALDLSITSINDLAASVARVSGKRVSVLHNQGQEGGVSRLVADVGLARELLGWAPRTKLEDGLRLTMERDPRFQ